MPSGGKNAVRGLLETEGFVSPESVEAVVVVQIVAPHSHQEMRVSIALLLKLRKMEQQLQVL